MPKHSWKADPQRVFPATPGDDWPEIGRMIEELRRHPQLDSVSLQAPHTFSMHDGSPEKWVCFYDAYYEDETDSHYCVGVTALEAVRLVYDLFFPKEGG